MRGLYRHPVSVCLSVTFVYSVKTNKRIVRNVFTVGYNTILVLFRKKRYSNIPTGTPNGVTALTGASTVGRLGKKCDSRSISGFRIDD